MKYQDIEIIYEDNHLLVVNKVKDLLVMPDKTNDISLYDLMREYLRVTYNKPGEAYLGIVHRLDRPNAGIVVFAKTSKAASRLSNQVRLNQWKKYYLAITDNIVKQTGLYKDYLVKDRRTNNSKTTSKNHPNAKFCQLDLKVLENKKNHSLVEIDLITGRSHQIRVQLASRNTPLYGDFRYNPKAKKNSTLKLFAYKLEIIHPTLKEKLVFKVLPENKGLWSLYKEKLSNL